MVSTFERFCDQLLALFTRRWVAYLAVLIPLAWTLISHSPADPDLFARVAMGRLVQSTGSVPLVDPFAFTQKLPLWIDHEWLSGVVFWSIAQHWGDAGLIVAKIIVASLTALVVLQASTLRAPGASWRFVWIAACLLHASFLWTSTIRCQVFTYLALSFLLLAGETYRRTGSLRYLIPLPVISALWINLHGGWALGICTLWLYAGITAWTRRFRGATPLLITAALCSTAPLFTPYGASQFLQYLIGALALERPSIEEWAPLLHDIDAFVLTTLFTTLVGCGIAIRKEGRDWVGLAILAFAAYCGYRHIRLMGFFMICLAIFGTPYFGAVVDSLRARRASLLLAAQRAGVATLSCFILFFTVDIARHMCRPGTWTLGYSPFAYEAITWLAHSGERGRLLVDFNNGSLALWRLYPHFQISIDGRYEEVYPTSTLVDTTLAFSFTTPDGRAAFERVNPTHVLLTTNPREISTLPSADWTEIYNDGRYSIIRLESQHQATHSETRQTRSLWEPMF